MREAGRVQRRQRPPRRGQLVRPPPVGAVGQARRGGWGDDQDVVVVGAADRERAQDRDSGALGHQPRERLVLGAGQPGGPQVGAGSDLRQAGPHRGEQLAVPGVPAVGGDGHVAVPGDPGVERGGPADPQRRVPDLLGLQAQVGQPGGHLCGRWPPAGRSEDQVGQRGGAQAEGEPGGRPDRQGHPQGDAGQGAHGDDRPAHVSQRSGQVRGGGHHHGRQRGDPDRQVHRRRAGGQQGAHALVPRCAGHPGQGQTEPTGQAERQRVVPQQPPATPHQQRHGHQHDQPQRQRGVREPPEPAGQPGQGLQERGDRLVEVRRARGGHGQRHDADQAQPQQEHVGGTARPGRVHGGGEQREPGAAVRGTAGATGLGGGGPPGAPVASSVHERLPVPRAGLSLRSARPVPGQAARRSCQGDPRTTRGPAARRGAPGWSLALGWPRPRRRHGADLVRTPRRRRADLGR